MHRYRPRAPRHVCAAATVQFLARIAGLLSALGPGHERASERERERESNSSAMQRQSWNGKKSHNKVRGGKYGIIATLAMLAFRVAMAKRPFRDDGHDAT